MVILKRVKIFKFNCIYIKSLILCELLQSFPTSLYRMLTKLTRDEQLASSLNLFTRYGAFFVVDN